MRAREHARRNVRACVRTRRFASNLAEAAHARHVADDAVAVRKTVRAVTDRSTLSARPSVSVKSN